MLKIHADERFNLHKMLQYSPFPRVILLQGSKLCVLLLFFFFFLFISSVQKAFFRESNLAWCGSYPSEMDYILIFSSLVFPQVWVTCSFFAYLQRSVGNR